MRQLTILAALAALCGCGSSLPTPIGDDTYYTSKTDTAGAFGDPTSVAGMTTPSPTVEYSPGPRAIPVAVYSPAIGPAPAVQYLPGPRPYKFDCDAKSGNYGAGDIRVPSGPFRVVGLLQFLRERNDVMFASDARIELYDSAGPSPVALEIYATNSNPELLRFAFARMPNATFQEEVPGHSLFATMPITKLPIPFWLTFDDSGKLTGTLGRAAAPALLNVSGVKRLTLFCGSAHVLFSEVTITPEPDGEQN